MAGKIILGVHSNVSAQNSSNIDGYTDGHAWLSITMDGKRQTYGLWPDDHPVIKALGWDNDSGSDIRTGMEQKSHADASRYYELTPEQYKNFQQELKENVTWRYTNTCASWASETATKITGQTINANDIGGFETPRQMGQSIQELEKKQPTSSQTPAPSQERSSNLWSTGDTQNSLSKTHQTLITDSEKHVHNLYKEYGLTVDKGTQNTVMCVAVAAAEQGMCRIDRSAVKDGNINVAQMDGAVATMATVNGNIAANTPVVQSLSKLTAIEQQQTQSINNPSQTIEQPKQGRSIG